MRARDVVTGSLAITSLSGLALIATGIASWGIRAVAMFTLLGVIWVFLLIALLAMDVYPGQSNK